MKNIEVIDDEYVSTPGINGIHLGCISDGFDISPYNVKYLSHQEVHENAEKLFNLKPIGKYPNSSCFRVVIEEMPPEIESQIDKIRHDLENNCHQVSDNQPIIEWLATIYEEWELYSDGNYDYHLALMKDGFKDRYLSEERLAEKYDFELEKDTVIPDHQKAAYTQEMINVAYEDFGLFLAMQSILFKTKNSLLVLGFSVYFTHPQADPELTWIDFFLDDLSFLKHIENDGNLTLDLDGLTEPELLALWD